MRVVIFLISWVISSVSAGAVSISSDNYEREMANLVRIRRQDASEPCEFGTTPDLTTCDIWSNRNGTSLQWQSGAGVLSNWLGGPLGDATVGDETDKGGYVFFETSLLSSGATGRAAQNAYLESEVMGSTGPDGKCITFSYALDGLSAAGLRVILHPVSEDGSPEEFDRVLWTTKDPTRDRWLEAQVLYTYNKDQQVVFEGLAKDSADAYRKYRGYVAVDNVAVRPGPDCRGHCTFEGGFCGWTNQNDDDFDWSLGRGSHNPSTGPATDRSSFVHGGLEGGYAYIDSSYPRRPGDTARLSSVPFDPRGPDSPLCLRFWTHMYGNGIGTLSVLLSDEKEDRLIWSLSGEAGNSWYQAEVPVSSATAFRIIFVGKVGKNNLADIAIDDISLTPGSCPTAPQVAAATPGDCTFEVDECSWSNVGTRERKDDIDWDRVSGQATRTNTYDHTLGSEKGFLMTLARNNVQRPGSRAWFTSQELEGSNSPRCISFWFVLNEPFIDTTGPSLGALTVFVRPLDKGGMVSPPPGPMRPVWRLYNHQGPEWRFAQAQILDTNKHVIVIEGMWGSSRANGFIGFDDITLFPGACSTVPQAAVVSGGECHFERDTCDWMNDTDTRGSSWRLATVSRRPSNLADKTFGAPEGYIYFDLFNQNTGSLTAKLISPPFSTVPEGRICLAFWFAAFGAGDTAELRIVRQDNSSQEEDVQIEEKIWTVEAKDLDTARPVWTPGQVSVDAATDFRLLLEGEASNGGFAIDDLTFAPGPCPTRPKQATPPSQENT